MKARLKASINRTCAIVAIMLCAPFPARAGVQHLHYELYAAGLDAVTASLDVGDAGPRYTADLSAQTRGLLGRIVSWQGSFHSEGLQKQNRLFPLLHVSIAQDRKTREIRTYRYNGRGGFTGYTLTLNGRDATPKVIDPILTRGTTDALSAALAVMDAVASNRPCAGTDEIFDGDRRYRLVFHDQGQDILADSSYSIYSGRAEKCTAEVVPLQGKWHAKPRGWMSIQEQGRKQGSLPTIWMARLAPDAPAVPVRVQVTTDYGTLVMHVTRYHNDADGKGRDHE